MYSKLQNYKIQRINYVYQWPESPGHFPIDFQYLFVCIEATVDKFISIKQIY